MSIFCKHQWKIISENKTESQAEQFVRLMGKCPKPQDTYTSYELSKRKLIQIVSCEKCGKLKRFVTEI